MVKKENGDLQVIDDGEVITIEELHILKKLAKAYNVGNIVVGVLIGCGTITVAIIEVFNFITFLKGGGAK
jgi:hypothetical protein